MLESFLIDILGPTIFQGLGSIVMLAVLIGVLWKIFSIVDKSVEENQ